MDKLPIKMVGKKDRNGNDYYTTTTNVPVMIDLSNTVIHFFPFEREDDDAFGGDLVFRHYDKRSSKDRDADSDLASDDTKDRPKRVTRSKTLG